LTQPPKYLAGRVKEGLLFCWACFHQVQPPSAELLKANSRSSQRAADECRRPNKSCRHLASAPEELRRSGRVVESPEAWFRAA